MGKQFGIRLTQKDMDRFCNYLYEQGFAIYDTKTWNKVNSVLAEGSYKTYSIAKGNIFKIIPFNANYTSSFSATFYPTIEIGSFRLWINSASKQFAIWKEFDDIKKWVIKNFARCGANAEYSSPERLNDFKNN